MHVIWFIFQQNFKHLFKIQFVFIFSIYTYLHNLNFFMDLQLEAICIWWFCTSSVQGQ